MKTAVVILNWNTKGFLEEFLPPLLNSVAKCDGAEVIVVDNASSDGSLEMMKEKFPQVKTIALDANYGFTGGYNKALKLVEAEYLVLINSDIEVTDDWLEPLVKWMESHPDCGACAPKLHSWQEKEKFEYAGAAGGYIDRFGYPLCRGRILKKLETDRGQYDSPKDVFWATGACLMVKKSLYDELGGLDEQYAVALNDVDFCLRLREKGYLNVFTPFAELFHFESISRGSDIENQKKAERYEEECKIFRARWKDILEKGDPYYNPNFSLDDSDYTLATHIS